MGELMRVLRSHPTGTRIIIFANTKRMCDQLAYSLMRDFRAAAIHGDKRQQVCVAVWGERQGGWGERERGWVIASRSSAVGHQGQSQQDIRDSRTPML